ncbi:MAG: arsenic transporter [Paenibacillaceae bacterium]
MPNDMQIYYAITVFSLSVFFMIWRPFGINEYIPASVGAFLILIVGIVSLQDVYMIFGIVSGAAITILSTIVMSIVLESVGVFHWAAHNLAVRASGSGKALYWYTILLCFLMTMFFNNDGSILITTPIIIKTLSMLGLKMHQKIPYLFSGALVATAASAPIGVSNLANLIALKIVGLDLNTYASMMFVPSMLGLIFMTYLLYILFKKQIPNRIPVLQPGSIEASRHRYAQEHKRYHPLVVNPDDKPEVDWMMFRICIGIVVLIRISFFALAPLGIPPELPALTGAILLVAVRWWRKRIGVFDIIRNSPWHILIFAFSTYLIVFGLHKTGISAFLTHQMKDIISYSSFQAIFGMGILLTIMSNLFNNLPAIMLGTLTLTEANLSVDHMQVAYLASVIGADIGSLILPIGTLASLIWMYIIRSHKIPFSWGEYLRITVIVIPPTLIISLLSLYLWIWLIA